MADVKRITPAQARQKVSAGVPLVCGYESDELFQKNHLKGAISLKEFHSRLPSMDKNQEFIFYCA